MSVAQPTIDRTVRTTGPSWTRKFSVRSLAFGSTIVVVSYLVLVPLLMLLFASIKSTDDKLPFEVTGVTLGNYATVLTNPASVPIFVNTLLFTVGSLAVGLPLAILDGVALWSAPRFPPGAGSPL